MYEIIQGQDVLLKKISNKTLYEDYKEYCRKMNVKPISYDCFALSMQRMEKECENVSTNTNTH